MQNTDFGMVIEVLLAPVWRQSLTIVLLSPDKSCFGPRPTQYIWALTYLMYSKLWNCCTS